MLLGNEKGFGTFHRASGWAKSLADAGHAVTLACDGPKRFVAHTYYEAGIKILETPSFMDGRSLGPRLTGMGGWGCLSILARYAELLDGNYDIVHAFEHYPSVVLPIYAAGHRKLPIFLSDWCDHYGEGGFRDTYDNYRMRALYRRLGKFPRKLLDFFEKDSRRRAAAVTVISRFLFDRAVDFGIDPDKITIIRGSIDTQKVKPIDKLEARNRLGVGENLRIVTFLGTGQFDVDVALHAFCTVLGQCPDARLFVLGKKTEPIIDRMIKDFSLSDKVTLTGWCPHSEMINYLSSTDVFVLPMRDNAVNHARWPNKINEYMAMGRPTVCSPVGDVAELVERERIGLVSENDPVKFGTAILTLLRNEHLANDIGRRARDVAERLFDIAVQGSQVERLYQRMVLKNTSV